MDIVAIQTASLVLVWGISQEQRLLLRQSRKQNGEYNVRVHIRKKCICYSFEGIYKNSKKRQNFYEFYISKSGNLHSGIMPIHSRFFNFIRTRISEMLMGKLTYIIYVYICQMIYVNIPCWCYIKTVKIRTYFKIFWFLIFEFSTFGGIPSV